MPNQPQRDLPHGSGNATSLRKDGFKVVIHDRGPHGSIQFLVFRFWKGEAHAPALLGSGNRDSMGAAHAAAERMVTSLAAGV
jgi:hypothetical protein